MSTLYLVATPIGNLEDISARALRVLGEVVLIACEDTRHTGKLLSHFKIATPTTSYFEHNKRKKIARVINALEKGDVALVSDAGTPGLNDPGYLLVREALDSGHTVSHGFYPTCGAPVVASVPGEPDLILLKAGSLDDPSWHRPTMDIYTDSAQPWDYPNPEREAFNADHGKVRVLMLVSPT